MQATIRLNMFSGCGDQCYRTEFRAQEVLTYPKSQYCLVYGFAGYARIAGGAIRHGTQFLHG